MLYISYCCYLITKTFISYQYYMLLYLDDDQLQKGKNNQNQTNQSSATYVRKVFKFSIAFPMVLLK